MDYPVGRRNSREEVVLLHPETGKQVVTGELYVTSYGGPPTRLDGELEVKFRVLWDPDEDPE